MNRSTEAQEYQYVETITGNLFFNNCISMIAFETVMIYLYVIIV